MVLKRYTWNNLIQQSDEHVLKIKIKRTQLRDFFFFSGRCLIYSVSDSQYTYLKTVIWYRYYWEKQIRMLKILQYPYIAEMEILCFGQSIHRIIALLM